MDREKMLATLSSHPLLEKLSPAQLERLSEVGDQELYEPHETIVKEGTVGDAIFLILRGQTEVLKVGSGGRRLAELSGGDFFGEMSLVEPSSRSASVVAIDEVEVFRLPNQAFQLLALEDAKGMNTVLVAIVRTLSDRLRRMNQTLSSVGQLSDWLAGSFV